MFLVCAFNTVKEKLAYFNCSSCLKLLKAVSIFWVNVWANNPCEIKKIVNMMEEIFFIGDLKYGLP
jgi:hypothetical protein